MFACKLLGFMILVTIQAADNKEVDAEACTDFLSLIKKLMTPKEDANTSEVTKKPKAKKFEERLEKYFEQKFSWWPSKFIEDLDVTTEQPPRKATSLDTLVNSYMDFLNNLLKMFNI